MSEMIKVEHEDELLTAECPAFYVMGVGHGHSVKGRKITTYTINANDKIANEYSHLRNCFYAERHNNGEAFRAYQMEMVRLLVSDYTAGNSICTVTQAVNNAHIYLVVHMKTVK